MLDVGKVSGQLGSIKCSAAHTQSLTASLLQRPRGGPPAHGLRLAVTEVQLSLMQHWPLAGAGAEAPPVPTGAPGAVCSPLEVQLLVLARTALGVHPVPPPSRPAEQAPAQTGTQASAGHAAGSPRGAASAAAAPDGWALWCAVSPAAVQLSPRQLTVAAAVASGCSAHSSAAAGFAGTPKRPPSAEAVVVRLLLTTSAVHLTFSHLGAAAVSAGAAGRIGSGTLHVAAETARGTVITAQPLLQEGPEQPGSAVAPSLHLAVHSITCTSGAGEVAASAALVEAGLGPRDSHDAGVQMRLPAQLMGLKLALRPRQHGPTGPAPAAPVAGPLPQQKVLRLGLRSASAALNLEDWAGAARLVERLASGPLLPATIAADPPATASAAGASLHVEASLDSLLISLAVGMASEAAAAPVALCLAAAGLRFVQADSQVRPLPCRHECLAGQSDLGRTLQALCGLSSACFSLRRCGTGAFQCNFRT